MVFFLIIFVNNQSRGMKDFVLKNGLTLGAIQVVMLFVSYSMGIDFMMQTWWGIVPVSYTHLTLPTNREV